MEPRTPIGGTTARDFDDLCQQRTLAEAPTDPEGFVRFACLKCPRTERIALATLRARFRQAEGLVNILNLLAPADCPWAGEDPQGNHPCGFCYRDLGGSAVAARASQSL